MAIIGAAGGLGQGILSVCRAENVAFTPIVRSRPERITDVPDGSRVVVITSLADRAALTEAFLWADAVITAMGVTSSSSDRSALLSANFATVEATPARLSGKIRRSRATSRGNGVFLPALMLKRYR